MDQQKVSSAKAKNTLLKFLPRATSSVTFQNPPIYSPAKDKRSSEKTHKSNLGIGFSGPMVSMIPADTRRKIKNNSDYTIVYEPTSPRVSCMGQVKCKHQKEKLQRRHGNGVDGNKPTNSVKVKPTDKASRATSFTPARTYNVEDDEDSSKTESKSKKKLGFKKIFGGISITPGSSRRKPDLDDKRSKAPLYLDKTPSLSSMKRFSSGRGKLSNIDWTKLEAAAMDSGGRSYYSDEESDDEEIKIPSSAPVVMRNQGFDDKFITVAGLNLQPRKEINLWKRRTMPQLKPLQLHDI
ncbi:uncharacterized protein At1g76070 [Lactuca sativa]|uniref:Syringolide-induced protein 14-1-1 n=1 Tax=Lactuca sativa TaxID=4236 RepID=A0A9R1WJS6_LACSA|nr:uncharacterized protein At1g76070 [Lactuca sativa]KAJ0223403.1 hypothetical protein LSAT_V11C200053170 [Lactuca sativa]